MSPSGFSRVGYAWVAVLVLVFLVLAATVNAGTLRMSDRVLLFVAQAPGNTFFDWVMAVISLLGSIELTGVAILLLVLLNRGVPFASWERWVPLAVFAVVTAIEVGGKLVIHQPSVPLEFLRGPRMPGVGLDTGFSFPSGHMTRTALVFGLVALRAARQTGQPLWLWLCVAAVWVMGFSRVYLGEHWPTDVAGGILLGGAGLALCLAISPTGSVGDMGNLAGWPNSKSSPDSSPPGTNQQQ
ncbi:MAG: phosphatase PAP2 family protein [Candidatus Dormibacteria bacterium]